MAREPMAKVTPASAGRVLTDPGVNERGMLLRQTLRARPGGTHKGSWQLDPPIEVDVLRLSGASGENETARYTIKTVCDNCFFAADEKSLPFWACLDWKIIEKELV